MDNITSTFSPGPQAEKSLEEVLSALAPHEDKLLVIEYGDRRVQPGYHVTEVKAGTFVTLDCGGNPDGWQETILQVEDMAAEEGQTFMKVSKFRTILSKVGMKIVLDMEARLTFELSGPEAPMQVFDVGNVTVDDRNAVIRLIPRPAICKPRHRTEKLQSLSCCAPSTASGGKCCG